MHQPDLHRLTDVLRPATPVASVYIGSAPVRSWNARWHRLADQLRSDGAGPGTIRDVERALLWDPSFTEAGRTNEVVVFAGPDLPARVFHTPGLGHLDLAWFASPAHVLPLVAWLQDRPPCVVLTTGRDHADIVLHFGGDDEPCRSELRFRDDTWERNMRTVAKACDAAIDLTRARLLVLAGEQQALYDRLCTDTKKRVAIRRVTELPSDVVSDTARKRTEDVLADYTSRCLARGLGVAGTDATLDALAAGQVEELLLEHPEDIGATAWFGPRPVEIAPGHRRPPASWSAHRSGLLADVAVRAAVLGGTRITVVSPGAPGAPDGGIGGVCRSPLEVVRS